MRVKRTTSDFIKVGCAKCKNEQTLFSHASTSVACLVCGEPLAVPRGGKAKILGKVL